MIYEATPPRTGSDSWTVLRLDVQPYQRHRAVFTSRGKAYAFVRDLETGREKFSPDTTAKET